MPELSVLPWIVLAVEIGIGVPILYLVLLATTAVIATRRRRHATPPDTSARPAHTFAVLIPAHNEELLLGDTLRSLAHLDYPAERYTVFVVADNCADGTAALAHAQGAHVYERTDEAHKSKGYALAWLLEQLKADRLVYDAYVMIDADSVAEPNFLRTMASALASGAQAAQADYSVLNHDASASTALRWIAMTLVAHVRSLGRDALGGSAALFGNGMCFTRELLERVPWRAAGLTEDYQYYLTLIEHGVRVRFVPETRVLSPMPTTFEQMRSQDIRWESGGSGERGWSWRMAVRLLAAGLRERSWLRLDALAEFITPPLSILVAASVLVLIAAVSLRTPLELWLAGLLSIGICGYIGSAFWILRPSRAAYKALLHAPRFAVRKLWIYFVARHSRHHSGEWVRTSRSVSTK